MQAKHKFLTFDQQVEHWRQWKSGDDHAGQILYHSHELFILKIARYYAKRTRGAELEDVISAAKRGFFQALHKFEPDKKCIISTYAEPWIRESIRSELPRISNLPKMNYGATLAVRAVTAEMNTAEGSRAPLSEIYNSVAIKMNREPHEIRAAYEKASRSLVSIDAPQGASQDKASLAEMIPDENAAEPLEEIEAAKVSTILHDAIEQLEPRLKKIISLRFGMAGDDGATLDALGQELNISKERVRQLENKAFEQLRQTLSQAGIDKEYLALQMG